MGRPSAVCLAVVLAAALVAAPVASAATPAYAWPVKGPVIRGFEAPSSQFSSGHRGIDIAAPYGSRMVAAQDGTVAFAGWVGGQLFISIDHPDGIRSTYSWLSRVDVKKGQHVARGAPIGATGHGHADVSTPHLHFGTRIGSTYIDPMTVLERGSVSGLIHLAPLDDRQARTTDGPNATPLWREPFDPPLELPSRGPPPRMTGRPCIRTPRSIAAARWWCSRYRS